MVVFCFARQTSIFNIAFLLLSGYLESDEALRLTNYFFIEYITLLQGLIVSIPFSLLPKLLHNTNGILKKNQVFKTYTQYSKNCPKYSKQIFTKIYRKFRRPFPKKKSDKWKNPFSNTVLPVIFKFSSILEFNQDI